jgi:Tfp pilus assembly protein PilO
MKIKNKKWKNYIILTWVLFAMVFLFEIIPDYSALFSNLYDILNKNELKNDLNNCQMKINSLNIENQKLKSMISGSITDVDNNKDVSSVLSFLDDISQKSRANIAMLKPGVITKSDNLYVLPIEIEMNAGYCGIYNYFNFLESSSKIVTIQNLEIRSKVLLTDTLTAKADLNIYLNL